jgi:hypothetical protein
MSSHRKASIRELATTAYELDSGVAEGCLHRSAADGSWTIDSLSLDTWFDSYEGQEIVLIVASLDDERPMETRTCRTCGREYVGIRCPHCHQARVRLRGR